MPLTELLLVPSDGTTIAEVVLPARVTVAPSEMEDVWGVAVALPLLLVWPVMAEEIL
jgi:hypothetical protein